MTARASATEHHSDTSSSVRAIDLAMRELRSFPRARWLDLARSDQSHRWRQRAGVPVEDYFAQLPEVRTNTEEAVVMICGEVQLRRELGESPDVDEYQRRFPEFARHLAVQFQVDDFLASPPHAQYVDDANQFDLPGYEFLEQIGSGASGVVYRARQQALGRWVAIKVMSLAAADAKQLARQRQEADILARLHHPNVVHIYEVREHRGCLYLVMEYVEGTTLADRGRTSLLLPVESARLVAALAETVQAVHEAGVLHRDLKPSNVLITSGGDLKITDFGLAKLRTTDQAALALTTADSVLGTPSYMSPEQALGDARAIGPTSDIYSLGAILYELVTGRPPFLGATVLDTLSQIRSQEPVAPRHLQPKLPRDLETICLHCLNKSAANRYQTAGALAEDLRRFLAGVPISARRTTAIERAVRWCRRNRMVAGLAAAVVVLLISATAILAISNASIRREAADKDAALTTARQAVDHMLMRVASEKLNNMPLAHPLREALLQDAVKFYEGFLAQAGDDESVAQSMAGVLKSLGLLQRELGRCDDACQSLNRSIELLQTVADSKPHSPELREELASTQEALAYTWQINPADSDGRNADAHYRKALQLYRDMERDQPARRQPVVVCLRRLAESAFKHGDLANAERFWRESIVAGEAYVAQQPQNVDARCDLCWSFASLADAILMKSQDTLTEAELFLKKGIEHARIMHEQKPRAGHVREVAAILLFRLGRCCCRTSRATEAVAHFQQAADEIESLCAEFPWYRPYWDNAIYMHNEVVWSLRQAGRNDDARASLDRMVDWLQATAPKLPDQPIPQAELRRCGEGLVALLRSTAQSEEADELSRALPQPKTP
jgi:serine/threonine-protein kinase